MAILFWQLQEEAWVIVTCAGTSEATEVALNITTSKGE